jgi:PilZ domain
MSFSIRPSRRFPVCCPVTYRCGLFEGHGTVWNLSLTGWRFSGNLPLRVEEVCSLTVNLPTQETLYVAAAIVRWVRGEEYGVETLVMDDESREDVEQYICQRVEDKWSEIHARRTARLPKSRSGQRVLNGMSERARRELFHETWSTRAGEDRSARLRPI